MYTSPLVVHIPLMRFRVEKLGFILKISTKCIAESVLLILLFFLFTLSPTTLNKMSTTQAGISHNFPAPNPSPKYSKLTQLVFFHSTPAAGLLLHMPRKYWTKRNANPFLQNFWAIQINTKFSSSKAAICFQDKSSKKQHLQFTGSFESSINHIYSITFVNIA